MTPISKKRAQNGQGQGVSTVDDSRNGFHQNEGIAENDERECPSCGITSAFYKCDFCGSSEAKSTKRSFASKIKISENGGLTLISLNLKK